jgi:acyl-CoA hydrolase/GNAT superfamily N-acetyltransferase
MPFKGGAFLQKMKEQYPEKFVSVKEAFRHIHRGDRIFVGTGCGEPVFLVKSLIQYAEEQPKALVDAEILHIWTLGVAPYTDQKFRQNFRHNAFFIADNTRSAVNKGIADYTPIFLSEVPDLFNRRIIPIDVALVQVSLPDKFGYMSYGINVDIVKSAVRNANLIIAQINAHMPRVLGDSFVHMKEVDFFIPYDEPLLEYKPAVPDELSRGIGRYVARLVEDNSTIQVGYGKIPSAILSSLEEKRDLGIHTELLSDGMVKLMQKGVVNNSQKSIHRDKTVATFCMGSKDTYEYLDDNPQIELHPVEYTNNPLIIARNKKMTAINTALEVDLTGQVTAESLGFTFYSGIGGHADFMRGATLSEGGKTIIALPSTAQGGNVSRIVPFLQKGAGVTLNRGDVHYIVTEYGIAYLHGKNIRERALSLISIAHPKFRPWLLDEAKEYNLIFKDQKFIPGSKGQYPEELEIYRTTKVGLEILLRPAKLPDEPLLKKFFYSLSDRTIYKRFASARTDMLHERLQEFVAIDYSKEMVILATVKRGVREEVIGVGQYAIDGATNMADPAIVVRDDFQNKGVGRMILEYLTELAQKHGLLGFDGEVLFDNQALIHLLEKMNFTMEKRLEEGVYRINITF